MGKKKEMGKKNKRKELILEPSRLEELYPLGSRPELEIIQHLHSVKKAGRLVIGMSAVLRKLRQEKLCVLIVVTRRVRTDLYEVLYMLCKKSGVIFRQVPDGSSIKLRNSASYGIKTKILAQQEKFPELVEKINSIRNKMKYHKQKRRISPSPSDESDSYVSDDSTSSNESDEEKTRTREKPKYIPHARHNRPLTGYLSVAEPDFLDYKSKSNEISIHIE